MGSYSSFFCFQLWPAVQKERKGTKIGLVFLLVNEYLWLVMPIHHFRNSQYPLPEAILWEHPQNVLISLKGCLLLDCKSIIFKYCNIVVWNSLILLINVLITRWFRAVCLNQGFFKFLQVDTMLYAESQAIDLQTTITESIFYTKTKFQQLTYALAQCIYAVWKTAQEISKLAA